MKCPRPFPRRSRSHEAVPAQHGWLRHAALASAVRSLALLTLATSALTLVSSVEARSQGAPMATPRSGNAAAFAAPRGSNVVDVVAHDFAFDLPASIPAGLTTFRLFNRGKQEHHFTLVRLDSGKTAAEGLQALIHAGRTAHPAWMHPVGGPNTTAPGAEDNATLLLEPGEYLAFCEVPGPDPAPHFMKGMAKAFTVTPSGRGGALPKGDMAISLTNYDFVFSRPLTKGHHVISVTNTSSQPHMMVITQNPPGVTVKDFLAWAYDPQGKPAPARAAGGVTAIAPGTTVVFQGDFPPGHYSLLCFSPDAGDGKPHFMHGMRKEIDVK